MTHFYTASRPYRHHVPIKGVVLDNDNTLYAEPENAGAIHEKAAMEAVRAHGIAKKDSELRDMFSQSRKRYGISFEIFTQDHGVDPASLRSRYYDTLIQETNTGEFFDPAKTPYAGLSILRLQGINLYIATHGNERWTDYTLKKNRIDHLFNDNAVRVCRNGAERQLAKNRGPQMYEAVLDIAGVRQSIGMKRGTGFAMIEDTPENLKYAKYLGMMTVLVNARGLSSREMQSYPYVDVVIEDRHDLANLILDNNRFHERAVNRTSAWRVGDRGHARERMPHTHSVITGNPTIPAPAAEAGY